MICPDGEGKGTAIALVEGVHYRGPRFMLTLQGHGRDGPADRVLVRDG
jgi:hypothetical protein